jgi:hypothetical protein
MKFPRTFPLALIGLAFAIFFSGCNEQMDSNQNSDDTSILPLLFLSIFIGYVTTAIIALAKIEKGQRMRYIKENGFDVSMCAMVSVIKAVIITALFGLPLVLLLIWLSVIPFESTLKYKLIGAIFLVVYLVVFVHDLKEGA